MYKKTYTQHRTILKYVKHLDLKNIINLYLIKKQLKKMFRKIIFGKAEFTLW